MITLVFFVFPCVLNFLLVFFVLLLKIYVCGFCFPDLLGGVVFLPFLMDIRFTLNNSTALKELNNVICVVYSCL